MEALISDHQSQNLDVLLIQESSVTTYRTHINHSAWRLHRPTENSDSARFRIYRQQVPLHTPHEASTGSALTTARGAIQSTIRDEKRTTGDFNRYQPTWGEDASELLDFLEAYGPRGTATYWSLSQEDNYGSDHRATYSEWNLAAPRNPTSKTRKTYDRADWDKIGKRFGVR
ncbi:reverse transcriptase [Penicillium crustosum]|uniref:reverse transcriptase n=1 Tax=Penicillium crustosum TaxID=36656 RepID=UPI00238B0BD8|nr:reverse transcriptase [Penicillium crustosum]KAJ5409973.1 reverse transcriptase [Penicillium crustosum]